MIATVTYSSLPDFYAAHHVEIETEVRRALLRAERTVRRLRAGLDGDAVRGEAALAAWVAAVTYRPELCVPYHCWAAVTVDYAIREEIRRQQRSCEPFSGLCAASATERVSHPLAVRLGEALHEADLPDELNSAPEGMAIRRFGAEFVLDRVAALPRRDREVLLLRFWEGRTLGEVASAFNVSTARAGQLVQEALARLRTELAARNLSAEDL